MLFFSAENHCRQKTLWFPLKSTKSLSKIVWFIPTKWPIYQFWFSFQDPQSSHFLKLSQQMRNLGRDAEEATWRGDEMRQHRHRSCVPRYPLSIPHCCHIYIYTFSTTGTKKGENSCQEKWIKERPAGSHDFCHIWTTSSQLEADGDAGLDRKRGRSEQKVGTVVSNWSDRGRRMEMDGGRATSV